MNTFKYDEDKGYVKRARALKRKEDPKPVTKASGRERNQTTDIGKNILAKDVKGGQSAGLAGSPSGRVKKNRENNMILFKFFMMKFSLY